MDIDKKEVGMRIRAIRLSLGLSMAKFAKSLGGTSRSTINNWERGINLPRIGTLGIVAEVGNTTIEYLLYGDKSLLN